MITGKARHHVARRTTAYLPRRGSLLPLVAMVVASVSLLAAALTTTAWRANRGSTLSRRAQELARAIDMAEARAISEWATDSLARWPLGAIVHRADLILSDVGSQTQVRTTWRRSHPLFAWLDLDAGVTGSAVWPPGQSAHRRVRRAVWLQPIPVPTFSALLADGMVEGEGAAFVSGTDLGIPTAWCAGARSSTTITPVVAGDVSAAPSAAWTVPAWRAISAAQQNDVNRLWTALSARLPARASGASAQTPASDPEWRAVAWSGDTVIVRGPAVWHGVMAVQGALRVEGALEVRGLLIVRRGLDATAATLRVQGAVLAGGSSSDRVRLGPYAQLQFDRCAVEMALATLAIPRASPMGIHAPVAVW